MTQATATRSNDTAVAVAVLAAAAIVAATWLGGALAIVVAGNKPHGDVLTGLRAFSRPDSPATVWAATTPGPVAYWAIAVAVLAVVALAALAGKRILSTGPESVNVFRLPGTATPHELARTCSPRSVRRRGRQLRPSLVKPAAREVGFRLGKSRGIEAWSSVEDSVVVLGPARSGKDLHLVVNVILDAPGAVIATSTRPDNIHQTITVRKCRGPVAIFDPQGLADEIGKGLRWSITRGCEDPMTAMIRAAGLAAGTGKGVESGDFWQAQTESALRALLMAAALDHRGAIDLYRWSLTPASVQDAVAILEAHPKSPEGWADGLTAVIESDPRQRDSVWFGVRQALSPLSDPKVLAAVSPEPNQHFDPANFINDNGTLYLVGTSTGAGAAANLVSAFIEDIVETARHLAAASPGARLDPPLTMMLNEIGNLAPLPSLPTLMSEGGGTGICTWTILQSLAQARGKWGQQNAETIWDASTTKIILGGGTNATDLRDLSALIGERDETTWTENRGHDGTRSRSSTLRRTPVLDTGTLRTLPFGSAVLLLRSTKPAVIHMRRFDQRKPTQKRETSS